MKKLIRSGVWETNSSSSHSVSIGNSTKEFVMDSLYPNSEGIIIIPSDEFGWDWFKANDAITKAAYAAIQFRNNEIATSTLIEVIKEHTGADEVIFEEGGYIDHESYGILSSNKETLRDFIFNKNSWLFGGNDNTTANPMFYDVAEYTDTQVIEPVYKFELSVDLKNVRTVKYIKYPSEEMISDGLQSLLSNIRLDSNKELISGYARYGEYFELGWKAERLEDCENFVYFEKDVYQEALKLNKEAGNDSSDWQKIREIENSLLKGEKFKIKINYSINEL